jgi:hypothetical protein
MIVKFISLATAIVTLDVYLQSQLYSSDPLFFFTSNNLAVNIAFVILSVVMVALSFKKNFDSWLSHAGSVIAGLALFSFGMIGGFMSDANNSLTNVLLPLNYLLILEAGVVIGICALSYSHPEYPERLSLSYLRLLFNKFAFLVPEIPHSPKPRLAGLSRSLRSNAASTSERLIMPSFSNRSTDNSSRRTTMA